MSTTVRRHCGQVSIAPSGVSAHGCSRTRPAISPAANGHRTVPLIIPMRHEFKPRRAISVANRIVVRRRGRPTQITRVTLFTRQVAGAPPDPGLILVQLPRMTRLDRMTEGGFEG